METKVASPSKLLWTGHAPAPESFCRALDDQWELIPCDPSQPLHAQLEAAALVAVPPDGLARDTQRLDTLRALLAEGRSAGMLLGEPGVEHPAETHGTDVPWIRASLDAPPEQLAAQLTAVRTMHQTLASLRQRVSELQLSLAGNDRKLEVLDEEMRLAARLQRDFLPRRLPEIGQTRFGVLFRPASWVSGDIYDIARLDETHVGFYVVDAVGHGMPAALLTMFIKKALQTKRIVGHSYEIVPPDEAIAELNQDICQQNLSRCQFCTAIYAVLDVENLTLDHTRAGHPEALLMRADGRLELLQADGALLGIFPESPFERVRTQLQPGDRIVLYTDGLEDAIMGTGDDREDGEFADRLATLAGVPREEMLLQVNAWIDENFHQAEEEDDITMLVVDIEP